MRKNSPHIPTRLFLDIQLRPDYIGMRMSEAVLKIDIKAVLPTNSGSAIFLHNQDKIIVIYVDPSMGAAISMFLQGAPKERPLTHDLIGHLLTAFGAKVERVLINDFKQATYFARLIVSAENELDRKKVVEIDARPSDCIAMAIQQNAPIFIARHVWDEAQDMSGVLEEMENSNPDDDPEQSSD